MVALSLKIGVGNVVKTMQFEPSTMVYDACRIIRERVPEAQLGQREWILRNQRRDSLRCLTFVRRFVNNLKTGYELLVTCDF